MKIIVIIISLLLIYVIIFADTHIPAGNVSGIWEFSNSPYIIDGEINIIVDNTLEIDPGVQVIFSGHYKFNVYGRLLAEGTENDTIIFSVSDTTGYSTFYSTTGSWHGLRFYDTNSNGQDSSKVIYCKLEYGKSTTGGSPGIYGGAILCDNSSNVLIKYCLLTNNTASCGGGICCYPNSSPRIEDVIIKGNIAKYGGGLYCRDNSHPNLKNVNVIDNHAIDFSLGGGGIYLTSRSSPSLENIILSENEAYYWGGGVCCEDNSFPTFNNVILSENSAMRGGGLYCHYFSNPSLTDVTIIGNTAGEGGGICLEAYSDASLMNVTILENLSSRGGGLYFWDSSPTLNNVIINDNIANGQGGGIYCVGLNIAGNFIFSSPVLNNVTISRNISLEDGGGIYCWECSNPTLLNCILWDNTPQEVYFSPEGDSISITISFSDVQNGEAGIVTNNNGIVNWLEGNIDALPLFVDPENGNYHLSWTNYPLPDSTMSPCIDAGNPLSPLDPDGTIADMGAFYFGQNVGIEYPVLLGAKYSLSNYPNPFNPSTTIEFSIQNDSQIELSIYNIKGQKIKTLVQNEFINGSHSIIWDSDDESGKAVSSGVYLYKIIIDGKAEAVKKCLLLK